MLVVGKVGDNLRQFDLRLLEGLAGELPHALGQDVERERLGRLVAAGRRLRGFGRCLHLRECRKRRAQNAARAIQKARRRTREKSASIHKCQSRCLKMLPDPAVKSALQTTHKIRFGSGSLHKIRRTGVNKYEVDATMSQAFLSLRMSGDFYPSGTLRLWRRTDRKRTGGSGVHAHPGLQPDGADRRKWRPHFSFISKEGRMGSISSKPSVMQILQ